MDAETRRVITDGLQILFDKDGLLTQATVAAPKPREGVMMHAIEHYPASTWPEANATDSITLDFDNRHRRRIRLATDSGAPVLLDLPKAVAMAHGDGLRLRDGRWLRINAAPEGLVEVTADNATQLARIAWHIGNRHFPAQILDGAIRIRPDHVLEAMIVGLGGSLGRLDAPFQPEGGAYSGQAMHGHAHGGGGHPAHGHGHSHDHHHAHGADDDHGHGHQHGVRPGSGRHSHSHD
jgi:urease accessory protein